ncbi:hypothetical protein EDC44_1282 [Cricetibacter osteomyelitidis]|uniref:Uncharacterized protein n=1 Tax=Cricetibacter osteomyelitidis TaxID=1521931 RepID=A0A4R2SPI2_9PAST|nr:hypothetical protein [Cricetibacter osteomyelitidis]TCP92049.1 hypothetical protein EDC44_1282 [Cricetibacter osteomyelitidis]
MEIKKRDYELFFIHPIILGGSSLDENNQILVSRIEHIKLVNYWNRKIKKMNNHNIDNDNK